MVDAFYGATGLDGADLYIPCGIADQLCQGLLIEDGAVLSKSTRCGDANTAIGIRGARFQQCAQGGLIQRRGQASNQEGTNGGRAVVISPLRPLLGQLGAEVLGRDPGNRKGGGLPNVRLQEASA